MRNFFARDVATRDVNVGGIDVDVIEQILPHEPVVAVDAVRRHRVVLVEIERDHVGEAQSFLPVASNQLAVNANWCGSRRETEYGMPTFLGASTDQVRHLVGNQTGHLRVAVGNHNRNAFVGHDGTIHERCGNRDRS
jgi:hypothetical protein